MPLLATDKVRVVMPWMKNYNDGTSAPGLATATYVLNDIYNIDSAGVSTSRPQMYDQFAAIWQNFKVLSVKVRQTWTIADGYRHIAAFAPRRVSAAPTSTVQCVLRKGSKWGVITMYESLTRAANYKLGDIAGPAYSDSDYTGQYNSSPSKTVALDIVSSPVSNAATSLTCFSYIEFEVEWSQRRNVANA